MINKVTNIEELQVERLRLKNRKHQLEGTIRNDFSLIKENLSPLNLIKSGLGSVTNFNSFADHTLVGPALTMVINFLVSKVMLRKAGIVKKVIATLLIRKYGVDLVDKNSDEIIDIIKKVANTLMGRKKQNDAFNIYDGGTVADNY